MYKLCCLLVPRALRIPFGKKANASGKSPIGQKAHWPRDGIFLKKLTKPSATAVWSIFVSSRS